MFALVQVIIYIYIIYLFLRIPLHPFSPFPGNGGERIVFFPPALNHLCVKYPYRSVLKEQYIAPFFFFFFNYTKGVKSQEDEVFSFLSGELNAAFIINLAP